MYTLFSSNILSNNVLSQLWTTPLSSTLISPQVLTAKFCLRLIDYFCKTSLRYDLSYPPTQLNLSAKHSSWSFTAGPDKCSPDCPDQFRTLLQRSFSQPISVTMLPFSLYPTHGLFFTVMPKGSYFTSLPRPFTANPHFTYHLSFCTEKSAPLISSWRLLVKISSKHLYVFSLCRLSCLGERSQISAKLHHYPSNLSENILCSNA